MISVTALLEKDLKVRVTAYCCSFLYEAVGRLLEDSTMAVDDRTLSGLLLPVSVRESVVLRTK